MREKFIQFSFVILLCLVGFSGSVDVVSAATVQGGDAYASKVVLLLHMDGANNSTTFTDSSASRHTVTSVIGTTVNSTARYKFGTASALMGHGLTIDGAGSNFAYGTADFTIEFWIRLSGGIGNDQNLYDGRDGFGTIQPRIYKNTSEKLIYFTDGAVKITGTRSVTQNVWHHIAVSRVSGNTRIFLDGVQEGSTYSDSNSYVAATSRPALGSDGAFGGGYIIGNLDEVRVTKGIGRYAGNFTVPKLTTITSKQYLLDKVTNADSAYSVRKLRRGYGGYALNVRRSSDDTTSDIGFLSNDELDISTLETFCASTDCFVTKWYDQSGNARDASIATNSLQPKIVSSGAVIRGASGKPAMTFDGSDDKLNLTSSGVPRAVTYSAVIVTPSHSTYDAVIGGASGSALLRIELTSGVQHLEQAATSNVGDSTTGIGTSWVIISARWAAASSYAFRKNGTADGSGTATLSPSAGTTNIGMDRTTDHPFNGSMSEVIYWKSDIGTARSILVETNQNAYYKIYNQTNFPAKIVNNYFSNIVLLLHGEGVDGSTTFTDNSPKRRVSTVGGNAQIDTGQKRFGYSSMQFDGTGDYLLEDGSSDFAFGTGNYTVEFWLRSSSLAVETKYIYDSRPTGTEGNYLTIATTPNCAVFVRVNSATVINSGDCAVVTNTWHHIAVSRSGSSTKLFVDGVQKGSTWSASTDFLNGASRPAIGVSGLDLSTGALSGWVDDLRVTKGVARYTSDFPKPTKPFPND